MTALPFTKVRAFRPETDVAPLLRLLNEAEAVDKSGELVSEAQLRLLLSVSQHNPETDRWVIEHPGGDGAFIAHAALYLPSETDDRTVADAMVSVHPGWRQRGLGSALFRSLEHRLAQHSGAKHLRFYLDPGHPGAVGFAESKGLELNALDNYTEMRAVLGNIRDSDVQAQVVLPEGFTLRSYREVNDLSTLVEALNEGYEGLYGHHWTTEAEFGPFLNELEPEGIFVLFSAEDEAVGTVGAMPATDRTERNGVPTGRVDSPGVVPKHRSAELYGALLLAGVAYLKNRGAVWAELESWGDDPEILALYTRLGFSVLHRQVAYGRVF